MGSIVAVGTDEGDASSVGMVVAVGVDVGTWVGSSVRVGAAGIGVTVFDATGAARVGAAELVGVVGSVTRTALGLAATVGVGGDGVAVERSGTGARGVAGGAATTGVGPARLGPADGDGVSVEAGGTTGVPASPGRATDTGVAAGPLTSSPETESAPTESVGIASEAVRGGRDGSAAAEPVKTIVPTAETLPATITT